MVEDGSSRIPGFYKLPPAQRRGLIRRLLALEAQDVAALDAAALSLERADLMVENVVGTFGLPLAVGVNFQINRRDRVVPMVVEEPSVVAAVSNMARLVRRAGGFSASCDDAVMIGQLQVIGLSDPAAGAERLRAAIPRLRQMARGIHPRLVARGGGLRDMEVRRVRYDEPGEPPEDMIVLHFHLDCVDAMGANMVNTVAEARAPAVADASGGRVGLRILSNLASQRLARASCRLPPEVFDGPDTEGVIAGIASAYRFAWADPWRAATHNKGIMNGIDAVALATGNDWRAIEAGAHAWAARDGAYRSLSRWTVDAGGALCGSIELPLQVGTVGIVRNHPTVVANLKILGDPRARELSAIMAAVGLAQNLAALRALTTEGIQQGHMRMHGRNLAVQAGACGDEVGAVVESLRACGEWSVTRAGEVLAELRNSSG